VTPSGVLIVARDAGAASALAPVVAALVDGGTMLPQIVAWGNALATFAAEGLPVRAFPVDATQHQIEALLESSGAAAVLTGTSVRADLDSRFWGAARAVGVPSLALLDHWKSYAERFTVETPFDVLPTVVAVMDDVAAGALVALGCPADRIRVTGQPRFDGLGRAVSPQERTKARRALGIPPDRRVMVFASQPRAAPHDDGGGYTQGEALMGWLDAVHAAAPDALALVKVHPVERVDEVAELLVGREAPPQTVLLGACPTHVLVAAADAFCGMTSIVLLDAALRGVPTVSVQQDGDSAVYPERYAGLIAVAESPDAILPALEAGLTHGHAVSTRPETEGAADRVVAELQRLVATGS
jgi:hypothetical protein